MNIILIGYRGCGKTTLGKLLAEQLWKTFVDVDQEIVKGFGGKPIAQVWKDHGEPAFREAEVRVTRELLARDEQVIALGGGTVMQPDARRAVTEAHDALRIYLFCETPELYRRIRSDTSTGDNRPSLTALGGTLEEIEQVLRERDPVYRAVADKVFDVTHIEPRTGVGHLIRRCL